MGRVAKDSPLGIAAYGMLPLPAAETVLDRYVALRDIALRGAEFNPERRNLHADAIHVAMQHLAQVGGYTDATALELDGQAHSASPRSPTLQVGPYTVTVAFDGPEPVIAASKAGRPLKSLPVPVRREPGLALLREHCELLRGQARRMRTGPLERLVATGAPIAPGELARLRATPAGAAMLPLMLWRDTTGRTALLDELDTSGPVTAAHPVTLHQDGLLAHWQAEIVRRRLRQPVGQAFRELYQPTPDENIGRSTRFADRTVRGTTAAQALAARGWTIHDGDAEHHATRPAGEHVAALRCTMNGFWGAGDVVLAEMRFFAGDTEVHGSDVPPVVFSEVMRDLDHAVTAGSDYCSAARTQNRVDLLAALINDLGLTRVELDGDTAIVHGSRAVYRLHLGTGSVHTGAGQQPCKLPYYFGERPHRLLFEPVVEQDRQTVHMLNRVLAADEKITDRHLLERLNVS